MTKAHRAPPAVVATVTTMAERTERRHRLHDAVEKLAARLDDGELVPTRVELLALASLCDDHFLLLDAARIRRWLEA